MPQAQNRPVIIDRQTQRPTIRIPTPVLNSPQQPFSSSLQPAPTPRAQSPADQHRPVMAERRPFADETCFICREDFLSSIYAT